MIEKIKHYGLTSPASIYDEEALTALELAGRTANKVNEVVQAVNDHTDEVNKELGKQKEHLDAEIEKIPSVVESSVGDHISDGIFDRQISEYLNNLNGRVDAMLEGTSSDSEILDARVDVYGENKGSAGNAIRSQIRDVKKLVTEGFDLIDGYNWLNFSISSTGAIVASTASNYISAPIPADVARKLVVRVKTPYAMVNYAEYMGGVFKKRGTWSRYHQEIPLKEGYTVRLLVCLNEEMVDPEVINTFSAEHVLKQIAVEWYGKTPTLSSVKDEIDTFGAGLPITWEVGNISSNGVFSSEETELGNLISNAIPLSLVKGFTIKAKKVQLNYVVFDEANASTPTIYGEWIQPSGTDHVDLGERYNRNHEGLVYFKVAKVATYASDFDNLTDDMGEIVIDWKTPSLSELSEKITELEKKVDSIGGTSSGGGTVNTEFLAKLLACQFDGNVVGFSVDDVIDLFSLAHDTINSSSDPYPLSDYCPEFTHVASMIDTGIPLTLNLCLEKEDASFKLKDIPSVYEKDGFSPTFASYFNAYGVRPKLSFHGRTPSTVYTDADALVNDYAEFLECAHNMGFDDDDIDHVVRLSYFSGDRDALKRLRDEFGVIGFYTRDAGSEGENYDLTDDEKQFIDAHGFMIDAERELIFMKSLPRADSKDAATIVNTIVNNGWKHNAVFAHESLGWDTIATKFDVIAGSLEEKEYNLVNYSKLYKEV